MNREWQDRWQSMAEQLQQLSTQFGQSTNPVNHSLYALTESLLAFSKDQIDFFWEGFTSGRLLPSMDLPQEHVLRATLDQVAFDMSIIQRISHQREQKTLKATQELADKLAQMALNVAVDGGLLLPCGALTYCNKSVNIRLIPYAPMALIGIPFTAAKVRKDLLAIPHEVGHFVYHHAPGLAARLHALIPLYPNWSNHWIEEIFADVFAAYVAGPVCGLSLQEIMLDNSQEEFVTDDGEHPPNAVRPYGFNSALHHLGEERIANELDDLWRDRLATRQHPKKFLPHKRSTPAKLSQARKLLVQTAAAFVTFLEKQPKMKRADPWADGIKATDGLDDLFESFNTLCDEAPAVEPYHLKMDGETVGVCQPGGTLENVRPLGSTQTWRDWIKKESRLQKETLLPAQAWKPVFTAGYWPVKGPEGNSDGGI